MFQRSFLMSPSNIQVDLVVHYPEKGETKSSCTFDIFVNRKCVKTFTAHGIDELHSIKMALVAADANLQHYARKHSEELTWNGDADLGLSPKCLNCGGTMA